MVSILTVKQVLVLLVIIKVTTVLLHCIDSKLGGIHLLGSELEVINLATDLAVRLALRVGSPQLLDIGAVHNVIPFAIGDARVLLGLGIDEVFLEGIDGIGGEHGNFGPDGLGLGGGLSVGLLQGLGPGIEVNVANLVKIKAEG